MNEIIIRTEGKFKSNDLNNAVKSFDKFFSGINKNWRDACILMHRLADGKKYEEDGFKSVADFAETIGIEKSTAHKMADAGLVYDSKNPTVAQFAADAGYTKASKVASIVKEGKEEELATAIEGGEISADDSVSEIASWKATKALQNKPEKVLSKYEVWGIHGNGNQFHYDSIELENVTEIENGIKVGSFELGGNGGDEKTKWTVYADSIDGSLVRITYAKVKKEAKPAKKAAKKSLDDMTPEEAVAWFAAKGLNVTFTNVTEK